jgi:hypothetical protein
VIAGAGIFAAGALVLYSYVRLEPPPGWASLAVLVMLLSAVVVISTGVSGLYVGKVFGQVKGRPLYVVDEEVVGTAAPAQTSELGEASGLRGETGAERVRRAPTEP